MSRWRSLDRAEEKGYNGVERNVYGSIQNNRNSVFERRMEVNKMERTLRVTGKGKISVKPDLIQLQMTLEGTRADYEEALELSSKETGELRDCFGAIGFMPTDVKTMNFTINTQYESYQDQDKSWKQRFVGYQYVHSMKLEFDADNERLGRVLYALAHCSIHPEFHIVYTIKDREAAKNQLLGKAVQDAAVKAGVLAEAAEVTLGELLTIDYSWGEMDFTVRPMTKRLEATRAMADNAVGSYALNIEPDNIEVTDTVTVVWRLA